MCVSKEVIFYIFTQQSHTYAGAVGFFMYFLCKYFYNVTHSNIHIHVIYKCKGTTSINLEFDFSSYENIVTTFFTINLYQLIFPINMLLYKVFISRALYFYITQFLSNTK